MKEARSSKLKAQSEGFTLIELIIYLAIVSVILVSISYLMLDILSGQTKSYAYKEVNQNNRFITNALVKDIRAAKNIDSLSSNTLVLGMPGGEVITYTFDSSSQTITRQAVILNSSQVEVSGNFSDLSYQGRAKNIGVYLEINYKNPNNLPDYNASINANFAVELRGRR